MNSFIFTTCQPGMEQVLKQEMAEKWPSFRLAYSRSGFITFKTDDVLTPDFNLDLIFARSYGLSLGKFSSPSSKVVKSKEVQDVANKFNAKRIHVWSLIEDTTIASDDSHVGETVLDLVEVQHDEWWLGVHVHHSGHRMWSGGDPKLILPELSPSRAYLKAKEAILWTELPTKAGQVALELGSSPGGASYALLELGLTVIGVDPGDMDKVVLENSSFQHLRCQATQLKSEQVGQVDWLFSDMNISVDETLRTLRKVIGLMGLRLKGGVFTLKLGKMTDTMPISLWLHEIRKMGFSNVRAIQLFHNRNEMCVVALK